MFQRRLLLVYFLMMSLSAQAQMYMPGEIIVKLKSQSSGGNQQKAFKAGMAAKGLSLKSSFNRLNMHHFALGKGKRVEDAVQELKNDPDVLYAEPNYIFTKSAEVGMHQTFSQSQVAALSTAVGQTVTSSSVDLPAVWSDSISSSRRPIVAVIDSGVDITHPVFANSQSIWRNPGEIPGNGIDDDGNGYIDDVNGYNFVANSGNMYDDDGHGTHVAGIVLSLDQNIFASSLRTSRVQIMPLKFMNASGVGSTSDAIRAIDYAIANGATVLNNSWGGPSYSFALLEAVAQSYGRGALFVAAAGNAHSNNDSEPQYPANYDVPNVISVAATNDSDGLASFSNYGANSVQLGSPGVFIMSTVPGNAYATMSGTSMAAPFVAGTAAMIKVASPEMLPHQMRDILVSQNTPANLLNGKVSSAGRLSPARAISFAKGASVDRTPPAYAIDYDSQRYPASENAGAGGCGRNASENGFTPLNGILGLLALFGAQILILLIMRVRASRRAN